MTDADRQRTMRPRSYTYGSSLLVDSNHGSFLQPLHKGTKRLESALVFQGSHGFRF